MAARPSGGCAARQACRRLPSIRRERSRCNRFSCRGRHSLGRFATTICRRRASFCPLADEPSASLPYCRLSCPRSLVALLRGLLRRLLRRASFAPSFFRIPLAKVGNPFIGDKPSSFVSKCLRDGARNHSLTQPAQDSVVGTPYLCRKLCRGHKVIQLHCRNVKE